MSNSILEKFSDPYVASEPSDAGALFAPESWLQPPIALCSPSPTANTWRPLEGVNACSSTYLDLLRPSDVDDDTLAWDAAADAAFLNLEKDL